MTISYRFLHLPSLILFFAAGLAGCPESPEQSENDAARERWQDANITHYRFEYRRSCECTAELGSPMVIEVDAGAIVSATYIDSGESVPESIRDDLQTVDELFDLIQEAIDQAAESVTVTYHAEHGFPTDVRIDYDAQIADEEFLLVLSNLQRVDSPSSIVGYYEHPFYDDLSDCPNDPLFNCTADLALCDDGRAVILVTDIINDGTYTQSGETIAAAWGAGDVPAQVEFTLQSDGSLIDNWNGWTWLRSSDQSSFCQ